MLATVVIPTYNRRKSLERTILALLAQTISPTAFEVIVVDDCSIDDTRAFVERLVGSVTNLRYIGHHENLGRAATRNDGALAASGEILIFLDDDNAPDPHFVEMHLLYHKQSKDEHIAVMGNVSFAAEVVEGSNFARYQQSRYLGNRSPRDRMGINYADLPPRCLGTLNCSLRRADFLAVGLFASDFRHYGGEDEYLGYCLKKIGRKIVFGEKARSVHYDDVSMPRYKSKTTETVSEGYKVILDRDPGYFESTQIRYLLPISWQTDRGVRLITKLGVRVFLNPFTVALLERWAILTDRYPRLYFPPLYRSLVAGWSLQGLTATGRAVGPVTYGEKTT